MPRGWSGRRILLGSTAAGLAALVAFSWWTSTVYGTAAWWSTPSTLHWCGRDYEVGGSVAKSGLTAGQPGAGPPFGFRPVGEFPPLFGRQIIASVTPRAARHRVSPALPCAMELYLRTGPDRYRSYVLEGGP